MGKHAIPDYKNSHPLVISLRKSRHPARTLGECIRKWRLQEVLSRKDLAKMIKGNEMTKVSWEKKRINRIKGI
jgi:ribosome-binding protein aMBF1 (putative translation factor)